MTTYEVTRVEYATKRMPKRESKTFDNYPDAQTEMDIAMMACVGDYYLDHVEFRIIRARPQ